MLSIGFRLVDNMDFNLISRQGPGDTEGVADCMIYKHINKKSLTMKPLGIVNKALPIFST